MEAAIPPILFLGGYGSTHAAREAVAGWLSAALGGRSVHSVGGPVVLEDDSAAWWDEDLAVEDWPVLAAWLDSAAIALGLDSGSLIVVGFSQGGAAALAWSASSSRTQPLAGVVCVAGFLPGEVAASLADVGSVPTALPPALVVVTEDDEVVDPFLGGLAARTLRLAGAVVTEVGVDAGHEWTADVTAAVVGWLRVKGAASKGGEPATASNPPRSSTDRNPPVLG